jgi:exodeoxyribonuclease VII large subunit
MKVYTVTEVTLYLKDMIINDDVLSGLTVKGEISNFSESMAGHCYFTLKDSICQLQCVLFKGSRSKMAAPLKEGMQIAARGRIDVYEKQGRYQLIIDSVRVEGSGELFERFMKLKKKLESEGLFDASHKKRIPFFPKTVGVVTSPYGAAVRDIITTVGKRNRSVRMILSPVLVQGIDAPVSICAGIEALERQGEADVIIVARGGGSFEELMPFSDERVARAIYRCPIPVISGVGHETDFSISDMVADLRAPTPTAAAQMAVPDRSELRRRLDLSAGRLTRAVQGRLSQMKTRLQALHSQYFFRHPERRIEMLSQSLDGLIRQMKASVERAIEMKRRNLEELKVKCDAYNPAAILEKGYCIAVTVPGRAVIRGVQELHAEQRIQAIFRDGEASLDVKELFEKR